MLLELHGVSIAHEDRRIIEQLDLQLAAGQPACLLGPSGSGKTTLLRAIAGFLPLLAGEIRLGERQISAPGYVRDPSERGVGLVFQDLALMPHLSVAGNIGFGLQRWPRAQRRERIGQLLELTGLAGHARHFPHELSGGQQQRVALARAMAPNPRLLLLDEPFSSLDQGLRLGLAEQVRRIVGEAGITTLMVTHDQQEAFAMGQTVGVMNHGRLLQWASPYDLYHRPASRFVADFIGDGVLLPGVVEADGRIATEIGLLGPAGNGRYGAGQAVEVLLRPDDIVHDDAGPMAARVAYKAFRGAQILYRLELASGRQLKTLVPSHHDHPLGGPISFRLELDHLVAFPA